MSHLSQKMFLFINMGFSMFAGSLLVAARFLSVLYEPRLHELDIVRWYSLAAGLYLAVLVCIALSAVYPRSITLLNVYLGGNLIFFLSEIACVAYLVIYSMEHASYRYYSVLLKSATEKEMVMYAVLAVLIVFFVLQLTAMILSCILQKNQYSRRETIERRPTDRGWKTSDEYSYHASGAGTSRNRTSRQMPASDMCASAPPSTLPPAYYELHNTPRHHSIIA